MYADDVDQYVKQVAMIAQRHGWSVAVAESLTSGHLAGRLGAGPEASTWFRGGVVAYAEQVKFDVLGVEEGPVVSEACAIQMARGAAALLDADAGVAATGVGGPGSEEGQPQGTVYVAVTFDGEVLCQRLQLQGGPEEILAATVRYAAEALALELERAGSERQTT